MASILDLIKKGAGKIVQEGKEAIRGTDSFDPRTKLGIARNTVLGLPKATRDVLAPTRGYTEKELIKSKPNLSQSLQGAPKVAAELTSGLGDLTNIIPGFSKQAAKVANTSIGSKLADVGAEIVKYGKPRNVQEAQAMRVFDVASNFIPFGGSIKKVGGSADDISRAAKAARELVPLEKDAIAKSKNFINEVTQEQTRGGQIYNSRATIASKGEDGKWTERPDTQQYRFQKPFDGIDDDILDKIKKGGGTRLSFTDLKRLGQQMTENGYTNDASGLIVKGYGGNDVILGTTKLDNGQVEYLVAGLTKDGKIDTVRLHATPHNNKDIIGRVENFEKLVQPDVDNTLKLAEAINSVSDKSKKVTGELPEKAKLLKGEIPLVIRSILPENALKKSESLKGTIQKELLDVNDLSAGEIKSLERLAQSGDEVISLPKKKGDLPDLPPKGTGIDTVITKKKTPATPQEKIGWTDYLRSPENVYRDMKLEKEFAKINKAKEAIDVELPKNIAKVSEIIKDLSPEGNTKVFRFLDGDAVDLNPTELKAATAAREYLDEWADRLKLPKENRVSNYITRLFDDQIIKKEFDEDLAKIIDDKIPSSVFNPFLLKRKGGVGYKQDLAAALDAYTKRATRKVYMDRALKVVARKAKKAELSQVEYIKNHIGKINLRPSKFLDTGFDNMYKKYFGYTLGQRPAAKAGRILRQFTSRGMIGGSLLTVVKNLTQGVNTYAKLGETYTLVGYAKMATGRSAAVKELEELGILADNFVTDRTLSSTKKWIKTMDTALYFLFDLAEKTNRGAAFFGARSKALSQGKSIDEATEFAKKVVRDTQFKYDAVHLPLALQGDVAKVLTQFMSYPVKQTEFLLGMAKNKEYAGIIRYTLGSFVAALAIGKVMGDVELADPIKHPLKFANKTANNSIPFYSALTVQEGARFGLPPSLGLPKKIIGAIAGTPDKYGRDRDLAQKVEDVGKEALGWVPAGLQIKRTAGTVIDKMTEGEKDFEVGKTPIKLGQALAFGKYSSKESDEFFEEKAGRTPKTAYEKQVAETEKRRKELKTEIRPIYDKVQKLVEQGQEEEADALIDSLTDEEYEVYKSIRKSEKTAVTNALVKKMGDVYIKVKELEAKNLLDEADAMIDSLTDEEYEAYLKAKKAAIGY